jgi:DNA-directed RNA polymerase sigma subunit (sigma70/sigma32)
MTKKNEYTQRELLIRIDERQREIMKDLTEIKDSLNQKVTNDDDFKDIRKKVNLLWDWKNKVIGYAAVAGAVASLVFEIIKLILL